MMTTPENVTENNVTDPITARVAAMIRQTLGMPVEYDDRVARACEAAAADILRDPEVRAAIAPRDAQEWQPIATAPRVEVVLLYREGGLYPVVGWRTNGLPDYFILEEGGPEDGGHRSYPSLAYQPTHWQQLPNLP